jgi:phosphoribosylanthranilate isomerase
MGVQKIGFNITPGNEKAISPELFTGLSEWISGVLLVGEVYGDSFPNLEPYKGLDFIQIDDPSLVSDAAQTGLKVMYRIDLDTMTNSDIERLMSRLQLDVHSFLLESNIASLDGILYQTLKGLAEDYPIILGFGFDKDSVENFIEKLPIKGIAINGGDEVRPGYRNFDEMADILELLEDDEY